MTVLSGIRETAWQLINTLPKDDRILIAYCPPCSQFPDGRMMMWRASFLAMQNKETPQHLRYPATHWMPLPPPPDTVPGKLADATPEQSSRSGDAS